MSNHDTQTFNWNFDTEIEDQNLQIRGRKLFFIIVLFCIILVFTTLVVCARWICRHRGLDLLPTAFGSVHAPSSASPTPSQGLDADAIKKLPIVLHQAAASPNNRPLEETECCICLSSFRDGEKVKVLPGCDHCFHCECVDEWLVNHSSCPLCRASLKLDPSFPQILIQEPPIRSYHNINLPL